MDWNFNFGWVVLGLIITIGGTLVAAFHRQIADNMASGVNSYANVRLFGLITVGVGFAVMANLHTLILSIFVNIVFKGLLK